MSRLLPFLVLAVLAAAFYLGWPRDTTTNVGSAAEPVTATVDSSEPERVVERLPTDDPRPGAAALAARRAWLDKNERALELLRLEEFTEAVALLEECVEAAPDEPILRRNLAEALVRWAFHLHDVERRYDDAIEFLERAIELAPEREDIETLRRILDRWKRERAVEEGFWTDDSPYFELVYDAQRDDLRDGVQEVLNELHAAYGDLRDWFVVDPVIELGRPRFRVVLYDAKGFDELTGLGHWAGGVFDGVLRLRVDDLERRRGWKSTARHELVHAFVREVGGRDVPSWLNEGLAQALDGDRARLDPKRLRHPEILWKQRLADGLVLFTLEELHASLATWTDPTEISAGYAQSLLLTGAILENHGEHSVRLILKRTREGQDFATAFQGATGVDSRFLLEDLEARLVR